jgi:hypothetical protein
MKNMLFALLISTSMLANTPLSSVRSSSETPYLFSADGLYTLGAVAGIGFIAGAAGSRVIPGNQEFKNYVINGAKVLAAVGLGANIIGELRSENPFDNPLKLGKTAIFILGFSLGRMASDALAPTGEGL